MTAFKLIGYRAYITKSKASHYKVTIRAVYEQGLGSVVFSSLKLSNLRAAQQVKKERMALLQSSL